MNAGLPGRRGTVGAVSAIETISAVTLATHDMARAVRFYRALGFTVHHGGEAAAFTSLAVGSGSLNLIGSAMDRSWSWWGRVIFHVADVDAFHRHAVAQGLEPDFAPCDAEWGERYFHITDPDGHELSFARVSSYALSPAGRKRPAPEAAHGQPTLRRAT